MARLRNLLYSCLRAISPRSHARTEALNRYVSVHCEVCGVECIVVGSWSPDGSLMLSVPHGWFSRFGFPAGGGMLVRFYCPCHGLDCLSHFIAGLGSRAL